MRYIIFLVIIVLNLQALQRCKQYIQLEKLAHYEVFGVDFPYWFGIGQLEQESNCRNVISRDGVGSQGLAQITFRVWKNYLNKHGIPHINTTVNQIRAQAYIMKNCKKQAYSSHLWVAYQIYNGGPLINKEIKRARIKLGIIEVPHCVARQFCKRKNIVFNNGQVINACDINYEYPVKVYMYGIKYKTIEENSKFIFW